MKKVIIRDAIMGSGKTTRAIERMKKSKKPFIYVTPFLSEVERILNEVPNTFTPKIRSFKNYKGETEHLYKRDDMLKLANRNLNIVTTHSLFSNLHKDDCHFFDNYDLIVDEVIQPIKIWMMV